MIPRGEREKKKITSYSSFSTQELPGTLVCAKLMVIVHFDLDYC